MDQDAHPVYLLPSTDEQNITMNVLEDRNCLVSALETLALDKMTCTW